MISDININTHVPVPVHAWVAADPDRERTPWREFEMAMHGTSGAEWFASDDVSKRPKNLGYYMGYHITQAYYQRATNKRQAMKELWNIDHTDNGPRYTQPDVHVSRISTRERVGSAGASRSQIQRARFSLVGFSRPGTSLR